MACKHGEKLLGNLIASFNTMSVRFLIFIAKIHKLDSKADGFELAFPQAELDVDIWMCLPIGLQVDNQTEADPD